MDGIGIQEGASRPTGPQITASLNKGEKCAGHARVALDKGELRSGLAILQNALELKMQLFGLLAA